LRLPGGLAADDGAVNALHRFDGLLPHFAHFLRRELQILVGGLGAHVVIGLAGGLAVLLFVGHFQFGGCCHGHSPFRFAKLSVWFPRRDFTLMVA